MNPAHGIIANSLSLFGLEQAAFADSIRSRAKSLCPLLKAFIILMMKEFFKEFLSCQELVKSS